jgi:excinuclease UvrABC ATPase subunit
VAHTGWIIDLGPGTGHDGGRIVFEGTAGDSRSTEVATGRSTTAARPCLDM